jgi:hypothetical protein
VLPICLPSEQADLPAIKAAVDRHNKPFNPTMLKERKLKDDKGNVYAVSGANQVQNGLPF